MIKKRFKGFFGVMLIICVSYLMLHTFCFSKNKNTDIVNDSIISTQPGFNGNYNIFSVPLPENPEFAGEKLPIEYFDVKEGFDREMLINTYWQSQTVLFIKRAPKAFKIIEPILKENNVPDDFKYLAVIESGLMNVVSPAGATGVWQFKDDTGKEHGLEINQEIDERYSLSQSTKAACKYILHANSKFNSWTLTAASFNAGKSAIDRFMTNQKQNSYYDLLLAEETMRYIYRIVSIKYIIENPDKYGFHIPESEMYPIIPAYTVQVDSTITNLADFAIKFDTNYKMLKYFNPWLRQTSLKNPKKKLYEILIPEKGARIITNSDN